jgi:hypothetical protein
MERMDMGEIGEPVRETERPEPVKTPVPEPGPVKEPVPA